MRDLITPATQAIFSLWKIGSRPYLTLNEKLIGGSEVGWGVGLAVGFILPWRVLPTKKATAKIKAKVLFFYISLVSLHD